MCNIDEDGSVAIPDFVLDSIRTHADFKRIFVARQGADACLTGFVREHLETLHQRTERRRLADEANDLDEAAHRARARRAFGLVEDAPCRDGRMRIPPAMRHLGGIDGVALFVGAGETFEIWNPEVALATEDEDLRELVSWRISEHLADETRDDMGDEA